MIDHAHLVRPALDLSPAEAHELARVLAEEAPRHDPRRRVRIARLGAGLQVEIAGTTAVLAPHTPSLAHAV